MRRLRFLRILLPALLLPFLLVLFVQLRPRDTVHGEAAVEMEARAEGVTRIDYRGSTPLMIWIFESILQKSEFEYEIDGVERLRYDRGDQPPLVLSSKTAGVQGPEGRRLIDLTDTVRIEEPGRGLVVSLERVEIHEAAGEARSVGRVAFQTPSYEGLADAVIYGLEDQPTRIIGLEGRSRSGVSLNARRAILHDGIDDIEFLDGVEWRRADDELLTAIRLRVKRSQQNRLEQAVASGNVRGRIRADTGRLVDFGADRLTVSWDDQEQPAQIDLESDARLTHGGGELRAQRIRAERMAPGDGWQVRADGDVLARGTLRDSGPAEIASSRLEARLDDDGNLLRARAMHRVTFSAPGAHGEADEAEFDRADGGRIVLYQKSRRRARLAQGPSRIAAERIITDGVGDALDAFGRVESTLLPQEDEEGAATSGLFDTEEAVHFVSAELHSRGRATSLTFQGAVRAWQGDRTLSADQVELDQRTRTLVATGRVATRMPRVDDRAAVSEAEFVEVSGERLDYSEAAREAVYRGQTRIRQKEGWLEAGRLEIELNPEDGAVSQIRAFGSVRFEFRSPEPDGGSVPVTGRGDRLVYSTADATVRLFGDAARASVQRGSRYEDTTYGRVLRYRLDTGALEVESGPKDAVKIKTGGDGR